MSKVLTAVTTLSLVLVLTLAALAVSVAPGAAAQPPDYRVIVHTSNPVTTVRRSFLADAYLKKVTRWPDERVIRPADLSVTSQARAHFSAQVLLRSVDAVKAYWQRRIFSGQAIPPPEFSRDEDVISYVLQHPSAVGYVSASADVMGVRVVSVSQ
jgi:hypothetical protein